MTDLPSLTFLDTDQNAGPFETGFIEPQFNYFKERPGGSIEDTLTIATGAILPAVGESRAIQVDTESAAATDELDFITNTNVPVGAEVELRSTNTARVIELRHNQSGAGKILLRDGVSYFLDDPDKRIRFKRVGTDFEEIWRSHPKLPELDAAMVANTGSTSLKTGISPNARRIVVRWKDISMTAASQEIRLKFGDSGGIETGGYAQSESISGDYILLDIIALAANAGHGQIELALYDPSAHTWFWDVGNTGDPSKPGYKTLSAGPLTQLELSTGGTFDGSGEWRIRVDE